MPIYTLGKRDRHNKKAGAGKKNAIMALSLTAMVDMFTVLVVFLLQNYQVKEIEIVEKVQLPSARATLELKPAHVVIIAPDGVTLDKDFVVSYTAVKEQENWMIDALSKKLQDSFKEAEEKRNSGSLNAVKDAVSAVNSGKEKSAQEDFESARRITVQADKSIDFLTIKKVMYTLTESGAASINFAVKKDESKN